MTTEQPKPTSTETLLGGATFPVTLRNGNQAHIFVRQLPARKMPDFLKAQDSDVAMIELCCVNAENGASIPPEFVDQFSSESHLAVVAEIERINSDFFLKWGLAQKGRAARIRANLMPEN